MQKSCTETAENSLPTRAPRSESTYPEDPKARSSSLSVGWGQQYPASPKQHRIPFCPPHRSATAVSSAALQALALQVIELPAVGLRLLEPLAAPSHRRRALLRARPLRRSREKVSASRSAFLRHGVP